MSFLERFSMLLLAASCCYPITSAAGEVSQSPDIVVAERAIKICQLVGERDRQREEPTVNRTWSRYKLRATDLGVPFRHGGRTYVLFGDTWGPHKGDAMAYTTDTTPRDGLDLTFLHDASGTYTPIQIPGISQGAFEVPVEGTSYEGRMYLYHTTDHSREHTMGRCVVAVREGSGTRFRHLYDLSERHFINVSVVEVDPAEWKGLPEADDEALVMFGSGEYRQSNVRLAYQPASDIPAGQKVHYFAGVDDSGSPAWSDSEEDARALFHQPCVGELSVTYNGFIDRWVMLYNASKPRRGITLRTAERPWGPWSAAQIVFQPFEDGGYGKFMHVSYKARKVDELHDPCREDEWGGEYGPYQFGDLATGNETETTIYFTMSTWNPYTVVLMQAKLRKAE